MTQPVLIMAFAVRFCSYIYCRAPLEETAGDCPRCGHPADPADLLSVERLM